jgi:hypothetical protein
MLVACGQHERKRTVTSMLPQAKKPLAQPETMSPQAKTPLAQPEKL